MPGRLALARRGVNHGALERGLAPPAVPLDIEGRFARAEPILLRGWLPISSPRARVEIESTRRWFERLRGGADFSAGVRERLDASASGPKSSARIVGTSVDTADPRELEKVHVDSLCHGRAGRDLYAKLSLIAAEERDESLRVRFSFGSERDGDWQGHARRALAADALAQWVFPESKLFAQHAGLGKLLQRLCGRKVRLSERIVYSNAPDGGASFHHDAEPRQLAVVYGQMCGATAWLALPRPELAEELAAMARAGAIRRPIKRPEQAMAALEATDAPWLDLVLNQDPRLTARLVERGAFYKLQAGDILILPSPSRELCAWHSVFALGHRPSVAHSYGLFALQGRGVARR